MNIAVAYIQAGMALIALPHAAKGPTQQGWNTYERCITTEAAAARINGGNLGLAHAYCTPRPTAALDVDDFLRASEWLSARGIDLSALLMADGAVQVVSGRENRCKLLYRVPRVLKTVAVADGGFELRCGTSGGLTTQDLLPPSVHPETRQAYEWRGDYRAIPEIPPPLLELWDSLAGTGRRSRQQREQEDADSDPVLSKLMRLGVVLRRIEAGKYAIICPFKSSHTTPPGSSDTVYMLPWYHGYQHGHFRCLHLHCTNRTDTEFLSALGLVHEEQGHDEWPLLEPLPRLPDVLPFSYEFLPSVIRDFVYDISDRMQSPPEFAAMATIIMIGSVIGRKVQIYPRQYGDWAVPPNLWGMAIGRSGFKKSPSIDAALAPIHKLQSRAFDQWSLEEQARAVEARRAKLLAKANQDKARAALKKSRLADVSDLLSDREEEQDHQPKRYIVVDTTVEALAEILESNPNGVLLNRDELSGWFASLEKEGQQSARAFYLTAADGDKSFTVDRILRGKHHHIAALCISLLGGIQPSLLAKHVRDTQQFGSGDDGLLQRFALSVYPDLSPEFRLVDREPDKAAFAAVTSLVEHLDAPDLAGMVGAEQGDKGPFLRFADDARECFEDWEVQLQVRVRGTDEHPAMRSHLAKYPRAVCALALIFHLADKPIGGGPVSTTALNRALRLIHFLETHARRIYSHAARPDVEAAKTLLEKIKAGKLSTQFSLRDIYNKNWTGLAEPADARQAAKLLLDMGYLRETVVATAGRPASRYEVNPRLLPAA